jgi:hypothetical protein
MSKVLTLLVLEAAAASAQLLSLSRALCNAVSNENTSGYTV